MFNHFFFVLPFLRTKREIKKRHDFHIIIIIIIKNNTKIMSYSISSQQQQKKISFLPKIKLCPTDLECYISEFEVLYKKMNYCCILIS